MASAPPERRSKAAAAADQSLLATLQEMLDDDETVTARGAVRRMGGVESASSLTRDTWRAGVIADFQAQQQRLRRQIAKTDRNSPSQVAAALAREKEKTADLERKVALLTASHLAVIRAVGELGGMRAWARFFTGYGAAVGGLRELGAMPEADVTRLEPGSPRPKPVGKEG